MDMSLALDAEKRLNKLRKVVRGEFLLSRVKNELARASRSILQSVYICNTGAKLFEVNLVTIFELILLQTLDHNIVEAFAKLQTFINNICVDTQERLMVINRHTKQRSGKVLYL